MSEEKLPELRLPAGTGIQIEGWIPESESYTKAFGFEDLAPVETDLSDLKKSNRTEQLKKAIKLAQEKQLFKNRKVKNVICIIGDGMGESHLKASRNFYGPLLMDELPYYRSAGTDCLQEGTGERLVVTDSSAGGTAILCGVRTRYGYIGLDENGRTVENLSEIARKKGMKVGIVTNDHMGDSTPACALVHELRRENEEDIYRKEFLFAPDILIGADCGIRKFVEDKEMNVQQMAGFDSFPEMVEAEKNSFYKKKCVSFWNGNFPEYDETTTAGFNLGENKIVPSFVEMVDFTLTDLNAKSKNNDDCGFFCMIENTCCDGWGHAQLIPQLMNEVQCFDEGVAVAVKFVLENPDTLLVITADHENADLRFRSNWENDFTRIKSLDSGHSSQPVPVIAFGAGAEKRFPLRELGVHAESFETGKDIAFLMKE